MDKEKVLFDVLKHQKDWVTAQVLASKCKVSDRTIRKYIASINTQKPYILSSPKGYRLNPALSLQEDTKASIQTPEERVRYIIQRLLHESEPIHQYDLSEELYISTSTLKNDLVKVKEHLTSFDLYLRYKSDHIWCEGTEKNRRRMVSSLLYEESNDQFMNDALIIKSFPSIPVKEIKEQLIQVFHKHQYFTNDYSLGNLLLHLCISIERIQNNCTIQSQYSTDLGDGVEADIAKELVHYLKERNLCEYNEHEIQELTLLIMSRSTNIDATQLSSLSYASFISEKEHDMVEQILNKVNEIYYLDLHNEHFILRFSIHIHNLLIRTQTQYLAKNSLTQEMKMSFPFIYDISAFIANMIKEFTGTKINDDEIAYIALHIGSSIDELSNVDHKLNAVVLCPQYYDLDIQLVSKLNRSFQDTLLIKHLLTKEESLSSVNEYDLLISTYRPHMELNKPVFIVHPLLTAHDIHTIQTYLDERMNQKKYLTLKENITTIFPKALFHCDQPYHDQQETMFQMCAMMEAEGCVNQTFYQEIMNRESISSTAFDNFAIPHSLKMDAKKTCVCVSIHHKPISWGEHMINFVFMISVNQLERKIFKDIFSSLSDILIDPQKMTQMLKVKTYEEFVGTLETLL